MPQNLLRIFPLLSHRVTGMCIITILPLMLAPVAAASELPHDLSAMGMFRQADWVVKAVMLGLLAASVATWTIWLVKTLELRKNRSENVEPLDQLTRAVSLQQAVDASLPGPAAAFLAAAQAELAQSQGLPAAGVKERLDVRFARIQAAITRQAKAGTGWLAIVGSTAPFIGLFGTVWGIMNSFIGIAESQTTNLAVVAPGIAEALLATALGLVVAIPAVVMYNIFARRTADYRSQTADMAGEVTRLVSLHLDRTEVSEESPVAQLREAR